MTFPVAAPEGLVSMVRQDEGFRCRPYIDSEGLLTIGIGFCLDRAPIPEPVAMYWCAHILENLLHRLSVNPSVGQTFNTLDQPRQWAIANMSYQMGVSGVCGFLNMWGALDNGEFARAEKEALDSVWAHQTPSRARRVARVIRTGKLEGYTMKPVFPKPHPVQGQGQ